VSWPIQVDRLALAWAQERLDDMAADTQPHERHAV